MHTMEQRGRGRDSTVSHISTRPRSHLHGHHARTTDMHNSTVRTHTHTHTSRGAHPPHAHTACPHQPSTLICRVIIQSARQRAATRIKQRAAAKRDIQALEDARAEDIRRGNMLKAKVVRCSVAQFVKASSYCFLFSRERRNYTAATTVAATTNEHATAAATATATATTTTTTKARIKESRSAQISKIATRSRTNEPEPVRTTTVGRVLVWWGGVGWYCVVRCDVVEWWCDGGHAVIHARAPAHPYPLPHT